MSVDALLVRVSPARLAESKQAPQELAAEIELLRFGPGAPVIEAGVARGERILFLDEWSATLVAPGHLDPPHPLACAVRTGAEVIDGLVYGAGTVSHNPPAEATRLASELRVLPPGAMFEPSEWGSADPATWITDGSGGYPTDADGVRRRADELRRIVGDFYAAAASVRDGVIVAIV